MFRNNYNRLLRRHRTPHYNAATQVLSQSLDVCAMCIRIRILSQKLRPTCIGERETIAVLVDKLLCCYGTPKAQGPIKQVVKCLARLDGNRSLG